MVRRNGLIQTISASGGLGCYKWYHSQILGGVSARALGPKGGMDCEILHRLERV